MTQQGIGDPSSETPAVPPGMFRRRSTVRRMTFEEPHELAGLVVRVKSLSVEELLEVTGFSRAVALLRRETTDGEATEAAISAAANLDTETPFRIFAEKLVEWNMVDDDNAPVPTTLAGVKSCEPAEISLILKEWIRANSGVSDDLKDALNSGGTIPVIQLPMEAL